MRVNTDPAPALGKPNILEFALLQQTLLPETLVQLVPLEELTRRAREIDATHPHFREETPLVVAIETHRRQRLSGGSLHVSATYLASERHG